MKGLLFCCTFVILYVLVWVHEAKTNSIQRGFLGGTIMKEVENYNINSINDVPEDEELNYYEGLNESERFYISHGWSRKDLPFLKEADNMYNFLKFVKDKKNNPDEESRKEAEEVFKKVSESYYVLHNSYIVSQDVRENAIEGMNDTLELFLNFQYKVLYKSNMDDNSREKLFKAFPKEIEIDKAYNEALTTQVSEDELGLNPAMVVEKQRSVLNPKFHNEQTTPSEKPRRNVISTELDGFDSDSLERNIKIMMADIDKVDPQWMKSSEAFSKMKESMVKLLNVAHRFNERMHDGFIQRDVYKEEMEKFSNALNETRNLTKDYLDYKGTQMDKSPNRKNKWMKQFREQPRINCAINIYDKLDYMVDHVNAFQDALDPMEKYKKNELEVDKTKALASLDVHLKGQDKALQDTVSDKMKFFKEVMRTLVYKRKIRDNFYEPYDIETADRFKQRIQEAGNAVDDDYVEKFCRNNDVIQKIVGEELKKYDQPGYKAPTVADLSKRYDELSVKVKDKEAEPTLKDLKDTRKKETDNYRKKLVSDEITNKNKVKREARANKAAADAKQNKGMGKK